MSFESAQREYDRQEDPAGRFQCQDCDESCEICQEQERITLEDEAQDAYEDAIMRAIDRMDTRRLNGED